MVILRLTYINIIYDVIFIYVYRIYRIYVSLFDADKNYPQSQTKIPPSFTPHILRFRCHNLYIFIFCIEWGERVEVIKAEVVSYSLSSKTQAGCKLFPGLLWDLELGIGRESMGRFRWLALMNSNTCEAQACNICRGLVVAVLAVSFVSGKFCWVCLQSVSLWTVTTPTVCPLFITPWVFCSFWFLPCS